MHIVQEPGDIDATRVPVFVADYLRNTFAQRSAG